MEVCAAKEMSIPGRASVALDAAAAAAGSCGVGQGKVGSCMKGLVALGTAVAAGTGVVGYVWCAGEEWLERRVVPEDVVDDDVGHGIAVVGGLAALGTAVPAGTAVVGYVWCAGEEWLERRVVPEDVVGHGIAVVGDGIAVVGGDDSATAERNWRQQQGAPTLVRHVPHRRRCAQHPSARARPHRTPCGPLRHSMQTAKRMHSH